jgi:hypothetical protein
MNSVKTAAASSEDGDDEDDDSVVGEAEKQRERCRGEGNEAGEKDATIVARVVANSIIGRTSTFEIIVVVFSLGYYVVG